MRQIEFEAMTLLDRLNQETINLMRAVADKSEGRDAKTVLHELADVMTRELGHIGGKPN
jgi:NTP pyrophosphatase (non-canonical NTP hydrolase)